MYTALRDALWPALYVLAWVWSGVVWLRRRVSRHRKRFLPARKTLVVGNLHSGGSGKTPITAAIAQELRSFSPVIISRGYRGKLSVQGARVDPRSLEGPSLYGDEPWMLSQRLQLPVFIGRNRAQILREAENQTQGRVFLLDDAFQNLSFRHDTDLVAIHTDRSLEDAFCLPLGDLRESFSALHFASALLLVEGTYLQAWEKFLAERFPFLPCFLARVQVDGVWGAEGPMATGGNLSWGAFCAIARPERFCRSLAPFSPLFFQAFPDHYAFTQKDADTILEKKNQTGAHLLITTEKDWHKAVPFFQGRSVPLYYLRIGYVFSKEFWYFLKSRLETV